MLKIEKQDHSTLTVDGVGQFKNKGDDWVPTSLDLYLVDTAALSNEVTASYSKIVFEGLMGVSFPAREAKIPDVNGNFEEIPTYVAQIREEITKLQDQTGSDRKKIASLEAATKLTIYEDGRCPSDYYLLGSLWSGFENYRNRANNFKFHLNTQAGAWISTGQTTISYSLCVRRR